MTQAIKNLPGITQVSVNLSTEEACVSYSSIGPVSESRIISAIEDAGFDASPWPSQPLINLLDSGSTKTVQIEIKGMTCQSCVKTIRGALTQDARVKAVDISLEQELAVVTFEEDTLSNTELISTIEDCGFDARLLNRPLQDQRSASTDMIIPMSPGTDFLPVYTDTRDSIELKVLSKKTLLAVLDVQGMTCGSCVNSIEKHLKASKGIISCSVALLAQKAEVEYDPTLIQPLDIVNLIEDIGFSANVASQDSKKAVTLKIFGMTCASCSGTIERELKITPGIKSASVNLLGQTGVFEFDKSTIGIRDIIEKIESLGFDALLDDTDSNAQIESLERTQEIQRWRNSFYHSCYWALPVSFISMVLPKLAPSFVNYQIMPGLEMGDVLMLILTIPIQFGIGSVFYSAAFKSLKHGSYTMVSSELISPFRTFFLHSVRVSPFSFHSYPWRILC